MENGSQMAPKNNPAACHFGSLFATFSEGRFFNVFWSPLGSLSASFWRHVAHFWFTFGALWLTFGPLGVTFAHPGDRFSHFRCLLAYLSYLHVISMKILCKITLFWKTVTENQLVGQPNRDIPKNVARTSTGSNLSFVPRLSRPGAEHLP